MRERRLIWFGLCLLCLGGAVWYWRHGVRPQATKETAVRPGADSSLTAAKPATPAVTVINPKTPALPKVTSPFAYRLSNTTQTVTQLQRNERAILLVNALIDTTQPLNLDIPERLRAPADNGAYIVQARGKVDAGFNALLQAVGAEVVSYVPMNAELARMSADSAQQLAGNALVQSVLPWEPYYKLLDPALLKLAVEGNDLSPQVGLKVAVFPGAREATLAALQQLGAEVVGEERSPFGLTLQIHPAAGTFVDVARLPGVMAVEPARQRVLANDLMRPTLGVAADSSTSTNYLGLTGTGVLLNVNDSDVDTNHPDLTGRIQLDVTATGSDPNGHGTHTIGTMIGNGSMSSTVTNASGSTFPGASFRGMATNAQAFVIGIGFDTGPRAGEGAPPSDAYLQETAGQTNVRISANPWNYGGAAAYDLSAASWDAAVRDALPLVPGSQPLIVVFSAGNAGGGADDGTGGNNDTVLSPGTAKNVITVGAFEQARNITNFVSMNGITNLQTFLPGTDSSNEIASFSSRGNVGFGIEGGAGRFKPDLAAPGVFVVSDRSSQWDTAAYFNPTNHTFNTQFNQVASTNGLAYYAILVPNNAVQINVTVVTNQLSINPFPGLPIYVRLGDTPTTNVFDLLATNSFSLSATTTPALPGGGFIFFGIADPTNVTLNFDLLTDVVTTNDNGNLLNVLSNLDDSLAPWYRYESGTSMAAAGVSGMLALMQEFFEQRLQLTNSPALMKALLINGARPANSLYDFNVANNINFSGWGLPSLSNTIPATLTNLLSSPTNVSMRFFDQSPATALATGQSKTWRLTLSPTAQGQPLRATLVWTDPPGNPAVGMKLVNDLDLIISNLDTGDVFYGNDIIGGSDFNETFDTNGPPKNDVVNNVENIYLAPSLSTNYTLTVYAHRVNVNAVTANTNDVVQDYALVVSSGDGGQTNGPFTLADQSVAAVNNAVVTAISNDVPLLGQRVGGNSQFSGSTNGVVNQWNFYVFTNTAAMTNANFTNVAFVTFAPPEIGVTRMGTRQTDDPQNATRNEADLDLFVSSDPNLTNLTPAVMDNTNTTFRSVTRLGEEKVLFTNSTAGQVYYIAVKSEDQQGAEYGFLAVATDQPFNQLDANGNVVLTVLTTLPAAIPPGSPDHPGSFFVLALTTLPVQAQKVVVRDTIAHQEFGDLIGALSHRQTFAVLNNHSFFTNLNDTIETFVYDDTGENDPQFPGARHSDGPGTLTSFIGDQAADGIWMFSMVNDSSLHDVGSVNALSVVVVPMPQTNGFSRTIPADTWFYDFVDVPPDATNLTVTCTLTGANAAPVDLYLRRGALPDAGTFDKMAFISPPGGTLTLSIFDSPPLNPGRYFVAVFNPNAAPVDVNVFWTLGLSLTPIQPINFLSAGNEPILDDAVTTSTTHVGISSRVVSVEVGVRIDHPRVSDLVLTLISPSGTRVLLMENRGGLDPNGLGSGVNITNVQPLTSSGGPAANTNTINVGLNAGTLIINYNMFTAPDDLRVYYDGVRIFDSGLVSGVGTFSVDFGPGISTDVVVVMNENGNPDPSDQWNYVATVVTKELEYATFTDDTNKTTLPIKFAPPPFGAGGASLPMQVWSSGFDSAAATNYSGPGTNLFEGWGVLDTNPVTVVSVPVLASSPSNVLALHGGTIYQTLPTVAGRSYTLTFATHGRPDLAPVSWWKGEGNALDSSDGNNGTLLNGVSNAPGLVGQAFQFGATGMPQVLVADSTNLAITNSLTIEAWGNLQGGSNPPSQHIIARNDGGASTIQPYAIAVGPPGNIAFNIENGVTSATVSGAYSSGVWVHVAGTLDGASGQMSLYIDGTPVQQIVTAVRPLGPLATGTPAVGIGNVGNLGFNAPWFGLLDEVTIYSNALSTAQVQDIYAAGSAGKRLPAEPLVQVKLIVDGTVQRTITANDSWQTNFFSFTAPSNGTVVEFQPLENGVLLDTVQLVEFPVLSNTFYLPEEPLSKLIGESSLGDWKLEVLDNRAGATNPTPNLVSWQLSLVLDRLVPAAIQLTHAIPVTNTVATNSIAYFYVDVPAWARVATNTLIFATGPVNLLFNQAVLPGTNVNDATLLANSIGGSVALTSPGGPVPPQLVPGNRYYLGVQNLGATPVTFALEVDFDITTLTNAIALTNTLNATTLPRYYQYDVSSNAIAVAFEILNPTGNVNLVARKGPPLPDEGSHDYISANPGTNDEAIVVTTNSQPVALTPGRWYLGVFNNDVVPVTYAIRATEIDAPIGPNVIALTNAVPFDFNSGPGVALTNFFSFTVTQTNAAVLFELYALSGNVDLTLQRSNFPFAAPFFAGSFNPGTNREQIVVRTNLLGTDINGAWYLGVPNNDASNVTYTIRATVSTNGLLISGIPIFIGVTWPTNGSTNGPTLSWPTVVGEKYEVQVSTDLFNWTVIADIVATSPTTMFIDPTPVTGFPVRFYRVVQVPFFVNTPTIVQITPAPPNAAFGPTLTWISVLGGTYQVLSSPDLVNWSVLTTITATSTITTYTDPTPIALNTSRFYRVVQLP